MSERTYAPRSGGRTADQRTRTARQGTAAPTEGTAALRLDKATAVRLGAGGGQPIRAKQHETTRTPRLRVAPPAPIRAPRAPFVAVVIALVVAGVLGILLINTKTMENSFELSRLEDEQAQLDKRQQYLENQLAGYESVGSLDAAAKREGLVKGEPAYIRLPDGKIIGVPKPGQGKPAVTAQDEAAAAGTQPAGGTQPGTGTAGTTGTGTAGTTGTGTAGTTGTGTAGTQSGTGTQPGTGTTGTQPAAGAQPAAGTATGGQPVIGQ